MTLEENIIRFIPARGVTGVEMFNLLHDLNMPYKKPDVIRALMVAAKLGKIEVRYDSHPAKYFPKKPEKEKENVQD